MRIEKYVHSCLLLTLNGERLLFDPGKFSFVDGRVKPGQFSDVSTVALTHGHPDHVDPDALKAIVAASGAKIVGNDEVVADLAAGHGTDRVLGERQEIGRCRAADPYGEGPQQRTRPICPHQEQCGDEVGERELQQGQPERACTEQQPAGGGVDLCPVLGERFAALL